MGTIQEFYKDQFNPRIVKARSSKSQVIDHTDEERQLKEIKKAHTRAHRGAKENALQMLNNFYFPKMHKINQISENCEICKTEKYDRNP